VWDPWAFLAGPILEFIRELKTTKARVLITSRSFPTGLADNLARNMDRIKAQHSQSRARADLALAILQWLSTAERQITTGELQHALACTEEGLELDGLTDPSLFVDCCFGLVVVDKKTCVIRLVHFSVNEFLQERRQSYSKIHTERWRLPRCLIFAMWLGNRALECRASPVPRPLPTPRPWGLSGNYGITLARIGEFMLAEISVMEWKPRFVVSNPTTLPCLSGVNI